MRALVDLGAALRRTNQRADAREPLRCALEMAVKNGARALATRARTELAAAGSRPRRVAVSGLESLTPSERRVAEMAAQGMSNREIAHALFVTRATVESHLHSAYRKLDVASRRDLAKALESDAAGARS
jgi:DNA-binding NarL/FixJ family response regulator